MRASETPYILAWSRRMSMSRFGVLLKKSDETVANPGYSAQLAPSASPAVS